MAGLIYFLKARRHPTGSMKEEAFWFAWSDRVQRINGRLSAENIQVPVIVWQNGQWQAQGRRLGERTFDGYAYPSRAPDWFACSTPAAPAVETASRRAALERRLRTTPLGRMCLHPEVRLALAQDKLAATLEPVLQVPDLLVGEDQLAEKWRIERPEAAAHAAASAEIVAQPRAMMPEAQLWRRRVRLAALRRIDAAAVGREIFVPCPAYFGEPYLAFEMAPDFSFKAGIVRRVEFWPNPESEARSRTWRDDVERICAVESRLFPLPPSPGRQWEAGLAAATAHWLALAPLRDFEMRSRWPLFPASAESPDGSVPPGFKVRISPEGMRELGGSYRTLATAGLSPYIAGPFADYCETQRDLLAAWSEDVVGLAMAKWGGAG